MVADIVEQQKRLTAAFKASGVEVKGFDDAVKDTTSSDTKDLAKRIGIGDVVDGFSKARKHAEGLNRTIAAFIPAVGGLVAAAGAIGIGHLFTGWTDAAADLQRNAQSMGISVDRLSTAQNALRLTGASAEAASSGLSGLQQTMRGALYGGDAQSAGLFRGLGIDIGSFNGGAKRALDVIPQVANAVQRLYRAGNPDAAVNLLSKVGLSPEWLTVLKDGASGWDKYNEAAYRAGHVTQQQAEAAKELQQEQTRLGIALETFGYQVAGELAPDLIPVIRGMTTWVEQNRAWLATDIVGAVRGLLEYLKDGGWKKVGDEVHDIVDHIGDAAKGVDKWKTAIELLGIAWVANSPAGKLLTELTALAAFKGPAWLGRLLGIGSFGVDALASTLLLSGDTANNPEANAARDSQIDKDATDYANAHPYRDYPAEAAGQSGFGESPGPRQVGHVASLSTAEQKQRAQETYDYYRAQGWSDAAAIGKIVNIQAESGFNDRADNGTHYGIEQLDANRQAAFQAWSGHSIRQSTYEEQMRFGEYYLHNGDPKSVLAGRIMQHAKTSQEAARADSHFDERPGSDAIDEARAMATDRIASQLKRTGVQPDTTAGNGAASTTAPTEGTTSDDAGGRDHAGRVRLEVVHTNAPAGVSMQVTTPSNSGVQVDGPKVESSMPGTQPRNVARDGW